jgi:uncharacterized protein (TIGR02058 family)
MTLRRAILEMGAGTDLHGQDYTKAAVRAVRDALQHSSLSFVRTLGLDPQLLRIDVTIGVCHPERVDPAPVRGALPFGRVTVRTVHGGLDVPDDERDDVAVIASAAVEVRIERG